jgi:hypothetical protein
MSRSNWVIFWALLGTFIVVVGWFLFATTNEFARGSQFVIFLATSGAIFVSLGIALILLTVKGKAVGALRKFLILTGAGAIGIPVSIVLHNVIYGLFVYFFSEGFWGRIGLGDEPVFFVMGIFICPIAFLVGTVGSIVIAIRSQRCKVD